MAKKLYLIGMGICDEEDLTLRALEALKKCKRVFAEQYTNVMRQGSVERLSKKIGKKITVLPREIVEGEKEILEAAKAGDVALLVPGDPMAATTHASLLEAARKKKIETKIMHASSIFTAAAGECGLQAYKFGKTVTITYWRENFTPTSFIDVIAENIARGAHTLCLLDIDEKKGPMGATEAIKTILAAQEACGKRAVDEKIKIFILWHAGWQDQRIWAGEIGEWRERNDSSGPAVIVILGKMHFAEEERYEYAAKQGG